MPRRQMPDNFFSVVGVGKYGIEKPIELVFEPWIAAKKNLVGVCLKTHPLAEITQVIRNSAKYHIRLYTVVARDFEV